MSSSVRRCRRLLLVLAVVVAIATRFDASEVQYRGVRSAQPQMTYGVPGIPDFGVTSLVCRVYLRRWRFPAGLKAVGLRVQVQDVPV